jgi:formate dehydrogenase subunit gamma
MGRRFHAAARWVAAAACAIAFGAAYAQSPAVSPKEADEAKQQQVQQKVQPLNNQPVWTRCARASRSTRAFPAARRTSSSSRKGDLARGCASGGDGRRLPVRVRVRRARARSTSGAGPIRVHGATGRRLIERFTIVERSVHWAVAITFTTLARHRTRPHVRQDGAAARHRLHAVLLDRDRGEEPAQLRGTCAHGRAAVIDRLFVHENIFRKYDWYWFKKGGGMLTGEHVPSGKANARPEGPVLAVVVLFGITLVVTGLILDFPNFNQTRATMQAANVVTWWPAFWRRACCSATSTSARSE